MFTVLIADDNKNWTDILTAKINQEKNFKVVAVSFDGKNTLTNLNLYKPDILILDILMPEYDGIYIVNYIKHDMPDYRPFIYILSGIGNDSMIKMLNEFDISYYSMKPVDLDVIMQRLKEMVSRPLTSSPAVRLVSEFPAEAAHNADIEEIVKDTVYNLGILPHLKSNKFAREAILFYINNPDSLRMLTKLLYPEIAKKHNSTPSAIERNVRDAIYQMQKNKTTLCRQIFDSYANEKITNGEFLSIIANYITKNRGE